MQSLKQFTLAIGLGVALSHAALAKEIIVMQTGDYSASKASLGKAWRLGTQMAFAQSNALGGVQGNTVKLIALDDQYKPESTVALLADAIPREKPVMLVGMFGTGNTAEVLKQKILEKNEIPLLGIYSGSDALRTPLNPYAFHVRASYSEEVEKMVENYATTGIKKLSLITEKNAFGTAVTAAFAAATQKHPVKISGQIQVGADAKNFADVVAQLKSANPSGIVLGTAGATTGRIMKTLHDAGLAIPIVTLSVNDVAEIVAIAGAGNAQGLAQVQVMPDPNVCKVSVCREFLVNYKKFGDVKTPISPAMMEGYITGKAAIAALKQAGKEPNRRSVLNALNNMNQLDLGGFTINFNPTRHNGSRYMDIGVINKNGRILY